MKLNITIDGKKYEVEVEVEEAEARPASAWAPAVVQAPKPVAPPLAQPPVSGGNGNVAEEKVCRSPIVGIVVSVNAQEGQQVQEHDALLVLEAMKMETTITSPVSGRVKAVRAHAGESVQAGQVLVEFD